MEMSENEAEDIRIGAYLNCSKPDTMLNQEELKRNRIVKMVEKVYGVDIPTPVLHVLIWAAEDEEALEILAAKRPSYSFYSRMYEYLDSIGYGDYEAIRPMLYLFGLDEDFFDAWIKERELIEKGYLNE